MIEVGLSAWTLVTWLSSSKAATSHQQSWGRGLDPSAYLDGSGLYR